tara:strand:- start:616 stop:843 length:228 start_codon:yes stop_codon:yes gene_type:complete
MPSKLKKKLAENEFYCVKCRKREKVKDICVKILKNKKIKGGVPTLTGECKKCDTLLYKFVKKDKKDKLVKKYGKC